MGNLYIFQHFWIRWIYLSELHAISHACFGSFLDWGKRFLLTDSVLHTIWFDIRSYYSFLFSCSKYYFVDQRAWYDSNIFETDSMYIKKNNIINNIRNLYPVNMPELARTKPMSIWRWQRQIDIGLVLACIGMFAGLCLVLA